MPKTPVEKTKKQTLVEVDFVSIAPLVAAVNSTTRRRRQQHHSSPLTLVFLPINWPLSLGKIMVRSLHSLDLYFCHVILLLLSRIIFAPIICAIVIDLFPVHVVCSYFSILR
ncbi:hypothetical protein L2E82_11235 [Cichorium intybus]|uniref:Uncharacterized protein n=1 Tax=Cichorium intybus TaxID=13427 RepID=A0ACB9GDZ5_CICIN|nr:hypothetical protein L2E82_11235 [Cichorium intybus]